MSNGSSCREGNSPDPAAIIAALRRWLLPEVTPEGMQWLDVEADRACTNTDDRRLAIALGLVTRKLGRKALSLGAAGIAEADTLRAGWQPQWWSTDDAARVLLLLSTYRGDDPAFAERTDRLCTTAEITEHVSILRGFAVFPAPLLLLERAREGVRSSMQPVFEAIACLNPYPLNYFEQGAWNQMVVKCVFVGASIDAISGLQERRNAELVQMLADLVAERRAAGRAVAQRVVEYIKAS